MADAPTLEERAREWLHAPGHADDPALIADLAGLLGEVRADERRYLAALMRDVEASCAPERPRDGERWARVVEGLAVGDEPEEAT